jgi:hypothetical protein
MPITQNPPDPPDVAASVERVRGELFTRLRRPTQPRALRTGIAVAVAVFLFGSGIGIGTAAANASTGGLPVPGTTGPAVAPTSGPSEFTFRIDCYTGPNSAHPSTTDAWIQLGYNKVTDPTGALLTAAAANPATACQSKSEDIARTAAYFKSTQNVSSSATCLTVTMPGIAPYYLWSTWDDPTDLSKTPTTPWESRPSSYTQENHLTTASYLKPSGYPRSCAQVAIAAPTVAAPRLASCVVDATQAAVFVVKGTETVRESCMSRGYQPWTN